MSVYLDNNATTPLRGCVKEAMLNAMDTFGNPSATHRFGQDARMALDKARRQIADAMQVRSEQVIFTSGGSESSVMAIRGILAKSAHQHLITTKTEHAATYETAQRLEEEGVQVSFLKTDDNGVIDIRYLETLLDKTSVGLVSVMLANNETGVMQRVEEISRICKSYDVPLHVDAVQALGKIDFDFARVGADAMTLTFHKCGGPKGVGVLLVKNELEMTSLITGGGHERNRRAGTENVMAIVGAGEAVEQLDECLQQAPRIQDLRDMFEQRLKKILPEVIIVGELTDRLPNTSQIIIPNMNAEMAVMALDMAGIAVSQGSACSSGRTEPSRVLMAQGYSENAALSALRISLAWHNTEEDIEKLLNALTQVVKRLG